MCKTLVIFVAFYETFIKFILFFTVIKDSNRCNLLFLLDKPVTYIVGKDISSGL